MGTVVSTERRGRRSLHGIPTNGAPTLHIILDKEIILYTIKKGGFDSVLGNTFFVSLIPNKFALL